MNGNQSQLEIIDDNQYKCFNCDKSYKKKGILKTHSLKKHGIFVDPFPKTPFTEKEKKKRHARSQFFHDMQSKKRKINMYLGKIKTLVAVIKEVKCYYEEIIRDLICGSFSVPIYSRRLKTIIEPHEFTLYNLEMVDHHKHSGKNLLLSRKDMLSLTAHDTFDLAHPDPIYHV